MRTNSHFRKFLSVELSLFSFRKQEHTCIQLLKLQQVPCDTLALNDYNHNSHKLMLIYGSSSQLNRAANPNIAKINIKYSGHLVQAS